MSETRARPRRQPPSLASATLTALRNARGWTERDLAEAVGISTEAVSAYERKREPSRERLEAFAAAMGYGPEAVDEVLPALARALAGDLDEVPAGPVSPVEPTLRQRRRLRREAARVGLAAAEALERFGLRLARERRARQDRRRAARLWRELERSTPAERRLLVEVSREHQTWAVAERLCHESAEAAADRAELALELAELALTVAELAPGGEVWHRRLTGYAGFFRANALRVQGELAAAEAEVARARALWEEGAPADPGLLAAWRPLDLEASLYRARRRFATALGLLDDALDRAREIGPAAVGRILLKKAATFDQMGEPEHAVAALAEAAPLVDGRREPRLLFGLRFNLAASLVKLGRPAEAEALLPEVRRRAAALGNELDAVRTGWLEGRIAAGLGRAGAAEAALGRARREFRERGLAYDHALASLDLSVLLLPQGRAREVRDLARQMLAAFTARSVHREALAALELFRGAAEREEATEELARRLAAYLGRARHEPELRFEP